ncbi:MAG: ECF transporter S component, partial [Niameybacter sp.]
MKQKVDVRTITLVGFGIALNIVGAFVALTLRLPIYLDSIGTIMVACLLGPKYAILTGLGGSVVSGVTFDIYSLYFAPVQITTGLLAGWMFQKGWLKGKRMPIGVLLF